MFRFRSHWSRLVPEDMVFFRSEDCHSIYRRERGCISYVGLALEACVCRYGAVVLPAILNYDELQLATSAFCPPTSQVQLMQGTSVLKLVE